jgi:hypothetical protein
MPVPELSVHARELMAGARPCRQAAARSAADCYRLTESVRRPSDSCSPLIHARVNSYDAVRRSAQRPFSELRAATLPRMRCGRPVAATERASGRSKQQPA